MNNGWLGSYTPDDLHIDGGQALITPEALDRMDYCAASEPTSPSPGRVWRATRCGDEAEGRELLRWVEDDPEPGYVLTHTVEALVVNPTLLQEQER